LATLPEILSAQLTRVEARLALYVAAEQAILEGAQAYSVGTRTLTRADLEAIADRIQRLEARVIQLSRGGTIRIQRVVPRDI